MKTHTLPKLLLLLALTTPAAFALAQAQSNVRGRIDAVMLDEQYIVIDGKRLVVREAELVITYKGEPVRVTFLDAGFSVFYNTRADGSVSEITLIGPTAILDRFKNH